MHAEVQWDTCEGVLFIGKAQKRARVQRTECHPDPATGNTYLWMGASTAMVNLYYKQVSPGAPSPIWPVLLAEWW